MLTITAPATATRTLPQELSIPFLTEVRPTQEQASLLGMLPDESTYNDYYSSVKFDFDGGESDGWNVGMSLTELNAPYDYFSDVSPDEDECPPVKSSALVQRFCRLLDGARVDEAGSLPTAGGNIAYIDWLDCLRAWKASMTLEEQERIAWDQFNPDRYEVCHGGTIRLIGS